jgi:hypothetical protein
VKVDSVTVQTLRAKRTSGLLIGSRFLKSVADHLFFGVLLQRAKRSVRHATRFLADKNRTATRDGAARANERYQRRGAA